MATQGIKLPEYLKSEQPASDNIPNQNNNTGITLPKYLTEEPSNIRKYQYGWAKEDMVLGDVWDIGTAWINSWGEDTYKESVEKVNKEKQRKLFEEFPEFQGGQYDSDAAVMAGSISTMIADPVYILMPWARAAQGANLVTKGSKLAALGFGVGAGDSIIRQTADTGGVNFATVGKTGLYGAVLSPVAMGGQKLIGAGVNKAFPNLFKSNAEKKAVQAINEGKFKNKNNLNDNQLAKVTNISQGEKTKQLFKELSDVTNYHDTYVKPILELTEQLASAENITKILKNTNTKKLFKDLDNILLEQNKNVFLTKGTKPYKFDVLKFDSLNGKTLKSATVKEIKDAIPKLEREMYKKSQIARDSMKKANQKYLEHISVELYNSMGFTEKVMKGIMAAAIRPIVGAGGMGAVGLVGGAEEDTLEAMMYTGAVLGGFTKVLNRAGIKGIPAPEQIKFAGFIPKFYVQTIDKYIRLNLATTTSTRLSNRNATMDRFSADMFERYTDTVRTGIFGKPIVGSEEAIGLANTGGSVEGRAIDQVRKWLNMVSNKKDGGLLQNADAATQADAIKVVRGFKGEVSTEANQLATRLTTYLKDFKKYFTDAGIVPEQDIQYYFPRKLNFRLIESSQANKDEFLKGVARAYMNIGEAKTMNSALKKAKSYYKNNKKIYDDAVVTDSNLKALTVTGGKKLKAIDDPIVLPINRHIRHQRKLNGTYEQVESQFEKYLVNDIPSTLSDLVQTSVKSVEFARTFGADGRLLRGYLDDLAKMYRPSSNTSTTYDGFLSFNHKGDVGHLKDAINGYFGVYGRKGDDVSRGFIAILSSLANLNLMERVAIANIGDLSQPFSNSRYWQSWLRGLPGFFNRGAVSQVDDGHGTIVKNALKEYTPSVDTAIGGTSGQGFTATVGRGNVAFFNAVGLTALTKAARRYAFNVGAIDTHISAKNLFNTAMQKGTKDLNKLTDRKSLEEIRHLKVMGLLKTSKNGKQITNSNEVLKYGAYDSVIDAEKDMVGRILINKAGSTTANRDAIIPQIGNRLLFTQSRNPWMRLIGQYSSWAMAKSAQTNAMLQRIENGSARQLVGMAAAMAMFGGIKDLRNFVTTGEFKTARSFRDDDEPWWFSQAALFSGNLGWLPTTVANSILYRTNSSPVEFFPGVQLFNDYVDILIDTGISGFTKAMGDLNEKAYDKLLRNFYRNAPLPILRNTLERLGIGNLGTYKKDINFKDVYGIDIFNKDSKTNKGFIFNKGGLVDQTRMLFNEGDVVDKSFSDAFAEARGNRQELFTWQGNSYTTRRADESDLQYENFLGKKTDNKVLLKEVPEEPADKQSFKEVTENIIIPKKKPVLEKKENIIIPKKKPLQPKEDKGLEFPSIVSKAEAAIVKQPPKKDNNEPSEVIKNFERDETQDLKKIDKTGVSWSAPYKLLVNSFWSNWVGGQKTFTNEDYDEETIKVLQIAAQNALADGRNWVHYTDYPLNNRGVDAVALVGEYKNVDGERFSKEEKLKLEERVNKAYGNNFIISNAKLAYDMATDPVMKAIFSVGGFSIQENENGYFINEKYNYNNANKSEGTVIKKVRKLITHTKGAAIDEGTGPTVNLNLGFLNQDDNIKLAKKAKGGIIKMAKGDTPSVAWMRDYFFDGKGGYDTFMTFQEFIKGPGKQLYLDSRKKSKGGVIRKGMRFGGAMGSRYGGGSSNQGRSRHSRSSNTGGGNTNRERYIANQYKTKTSNKGGGNVGSGGNNNNNNNNTNKNTKKNNALEKVFDVLGSGDTSILGKTKKSTDIYNDDSWEGLDLDSGSIQSTQPVSVQPIYGFKIDNPIKTGNPNVGLEGIAGAEVIGPTYKGEAYLSGSTNIKNIGDVNKSFNIDFSNQRGVDVTASYDLNNSILSGNVSKFTPIGNSKYSVGVGLDYNDGNIGPSFKIRKDFKKGGLLDKKRG